MERKQIIDFYSYSVMSPYGVNIGYSKERSVVNSICITTGTSWYDTVKSYIDQCHYRVAMPSYTTCLTDTLRANGFVPFRFGGTVQKLLDYCDATFSYRNKYIIKLSFGYMAVVPVESTGQYIVKGLWLGGTPSLQHRIAEVWLYVLGTDNRTGIKRTTKERTATEESNNLTVKNMNPENRHVEDCVIRALSAAYGCTWHEAMDLIAKALRYTDPILNYRPNTQLALSELGFERHKAIRRGGKYLNGNQFCEYLNNTCSNGERIFAYVGKHHCAAILPTIQEDGSVKYKLQDTWDSTSKCIEEYWVYKEEDKTVNPQQEPKKETLNVGGQINHPRFGLGEIKEIAESNGSRILTVEFRSVGQKRISEEWLMKAACT